MKSEVPSNIQTTVLAWHRITRLVSVKIAANDCPASSWLNLSMHLGMATAANDLTELYGVFPRQLAIDILGVMNLQDASGITTLTNVVGSCDALLSESLPLGTLIVVVRHVGEWTLLLGRTMSACTTTSEGARRSRG
jgi:hypothetical protein